MIPVGERAVPRIKHVQRLLVITPNPWTTVTWKQNVFRYYLKRKWAPTKQRLRKTVAREIIAAKVAKLWFGDTIQSDHFMT